MLNVVSFDEEDYSVENTVRAPSLEIVRSDVVVEPMEIFVAEYLLRNGTRVRELPSSLRTFYEQLKPLKTHQHV